MHRLTDLLEQKPDIDAEEYLQINQIKWIEIATWHWHNVPRGAFFATNSMSALDYCRKCVDSDDSLTPMMHVDESSPQGQHLWYFRQTCCAIDCMIAVLLPVSGNRTNVKGTKDFVTTIVLYHSAVEILIEFEIDHIVTTHTTINLRTLGTRILNLVPLANISFGHLWGVAAFQAESVLRKLTRIS